MAEALLIHRLTQADVHGVGVMSGGFLPGGTPVADEVIDVMRGRGIGIESHLSHEVTEADLVEADLVLAMARQHVREAVMTDPGCFPRTFTLKELVRRADENGGPADGETFEAWLARLNVGRTPTQHLGSSELDDVADPVGRPRRIFKRTANELDDLLDRLGVHLRWWEPQS